jgi:protein-tyrosine phosphatase
MFAIETATAGGLYIAPHPRGASEIAQFAAQGITCIVSLIEAPEALVLGIAEAPLWCARAGMEFVSLPIADFALPAPSAFTATVADIVARMNDGQQVLVHCRAGIGRSGMVCSGVLMALGATAEAAVRRVTAARGQEVPDTAEQRAFIARFVPQ